jgi:hypothetical protein
MATIGRIAVAKIDSSDTYGASGADYTTASKSNNKCFSRFPELRSPKWF